MNSKPTAGAVKRSVLLLALALLASGCPVSDSEPPTIGSTDKLAPVPDEYPQAALDYIEAALKDPAKEGKTPALVYTWTVIAQLDRLPEAQGGSKIRALVAENVKTAADKPTAELVAAWLNCAPELALAFIRKDAAAGHWTYLDALWFHPDQARKLLADKATRIIPDTGVSVELAQRWLHAQAYWAYADQRDGDLLALISNIDNDPRDSLRAAGWLARLQPEQQAWVDYLKHGLQKAGPGKYGPLEGASEGIKISRSAKLADILVPIAKSVILTDTPITKGMEKLKELKEANAQQLYTGYALAFLPGEQAQLLRRKLLKAKDARIAWYARLGELLHGEAKYWDEAVAQDNFAGTEWWLALESVDTPEPALLPTYAKMAASKDASVRLRALSKLNNFRQYADRAEVRDVILKLTKDELPQVRVAAWYCAGKNGVGDPQQVFEDAKQTPEVRLAAAYAWLMEAQDGPPELRGVTLESISKFADDGRGGDLPHPDDNEDAADRAGQAPAPTQDGVAKEGGK